MFLYICLSKPAECIWASQVMLVSKNPVANTGDTRESDSILGSRSFPGEGVGAPLQYSCLGNPMDRGAWWAAVHGVAKSQTRLSDLTQSSPSAQSV